MVIFGSMNFESIRFYCVPSCALFCELPNASVLNFLLSYDVTVIQRITHVNIVLATRHMKLLVGTITS